MVQVQARVILKGAKSYNLGGKRFIQDVPVLINGEEEVKSFQQNGYFSVTMLKSKKIEAASKEEDEEDMDEEETSGKSKKGLLKKKSK